MATLTKKQLHEITATQSTLGKSKLSIDPKLEHEILEKLGAQMNILIDKINDLNKTLGQKGQQLPAQNAPSKLKR